VATETLSRMLQVRITMAAARPGIPARPDSLPESISLAT
jgi:hypothetical protein